MIKKTKYELFLESKERVPQPRGFKTDQHMDYLWDWQKDLVLWACEMGTSALFEDCGLGKTRQQLAWADAVFRETGKDVLILAPLAVAEQTHREANDCGLNTQVCRTGSDCIQGINITNYEMIDHFDSSQFGGIVLDESSILKGYGSKTRIALGEFSKHINYRLCCTATPAPNDLIEIVNHAEFLGVLRGKEIVARFFIQDGNTTHKWRLKRHAITDFYQWLGTWARAIRKPSDLGYPDDGFDLPPMQIHNHVVDGHISDGYLIPMVASTLGERQQARRESIGARCGIVADIVNSTDEPTLVWCDFNAESEMLKKLIPGAIEVKGSDTPKHKTDAMNGFTTGDHRVIVTKPSIAGFGMNWQHCNNVCFAGLSDSFEQYYQAIRRCYRFGQKRTVDIHIVTADTEDSVISNIMRKQRDAEHMMAQLVGHMNDGKDGRSKTDEFYNNTNSMEIPSWIK